MTRTRRVAARRKAGIGLCEKVVLNQNLEKAAFFAGSTSSLRMAKTIVQLNSPFFLPCSRPNQVWDWLVELFDRAAFS
jgi:hypothetical protein